MISSVKFAGSAEDTDLEAGAGAAFAADSSASVKTASAGAVSAATESAVKNRPASQESPHRL